MKRKAKIHRMILDVVSNYPVDSNLCAGEHYPKFEQVRVEVICQTQGSVFHQISKH